MKLTHEDHDQLTVMTVRGELVAEDVDTFRRTALDRMTDRVRDFVLDVSRLEAVDSKGLEALLWLSEEAATRLGQVRLASPSANLRTILEITRLTGRLPCCDDVDAAIESLR